MLGEVTDVVRRAHKSVEGVVGKLGGEVLRQVAQVGPVQLDCRDHVRVGIVRVSGRVSLGVGDDPAAVGGVVGVGRGMAGQIGGETDDLGIVRVGPLNRGEAVADG